MIAFIVGLIMFCLGFVIGSLYRIDGINGYDKGFDDGFRYHSSLIQQKLILDNLRESKFHGTEGDEKECQECHFYHG